MAVLNNFIVNCAKKSWIPDRIPIGKKLRRIGGGYVDKTTLTTTLLDGTEEKEELKIIT